MLPSQGSSSGNPRPRATSPAERAEESAAVQRRLKQQAAERRVLASASGNKRVPTGLSQRAGQQGRRRQTP
jgi:hypothetical protein